MSVTPNTPFPTTLKSTSDTFSFFKGSTEPELWLKSLGAFTDEQAERYGDKPALIVPWQSATLSYRQLADRSWEVAERLHGLGLRHGDRVGIMAGNRFEYLVVLIGAARLGCPVVVLNNTYTPDELHNALQVTGKISIENAHYLVFIHANDKPTQAPGSYLSHLILAPET